MYPHQSFLYTALLVLAAVYSDADALPLDDTLLPFPETTLGPAQLGVVANEADPASLEIARYYLEKRGIPEGNLIRVRLPTGQRILSRAEFEAVRKEVDSKTPAHIQAYALAWTAPFAVDCMSITSAFAFGFDPAYCSVRRCATTRPSPYFQSTSRAPFRDHHIRPAMLLAGRNVEDVKRLIDRGLTSDRTYPNGTGYLVKTPDPARSVRADGFDQTIKNLGPAIRLQRVDGAGIQDKDDVLFYFTGLTHVPYLDTLKFRPGALADHLTSIGGVLTGSKQMSSLRWLEAGATASYGTVVEPCNLLGKFPAPAVAIWYYAAGETALEAYWKSVQQPGEGVFIGDPLAAPFAPRLQATGGGAHLDVFSPAPRLLWLSHAEAMIGPYRETGNALALGPGLSRLDFTLPREPGYFRLELATGAGVQSSAPLPKAAR